MAKKDPSEVTAEVNEQTQNSFSSYPLMTLLDLTGSG
jgi:hypothetical protein